MGKHTKRNSKYSMRIQKKAKPRSDNTLRSEQTVPQRRPNDITHAAIMYQKSSWFYKNGDFHTVSGMIMKLNYKT